MYLPSMGGIKKTLKDFQTVSEFSHFGFPIPPFVLFLPLSLLSKSPFVCLLLCWCKWTRPPPNGRDGKSFTLLIDSGAFCLLKSVAFVHKLSMFTVS